MKLAVNISIGNQGREEEEKKEQEKPVVVGQHVKIENNEDMSDDQVSEHHFYTADFIDASATETKAMFKHTGVRAAFIHLAHKNPSTPMTQEVWETIFRHVSQLAGGQPQVIQIWCTDEFCPSLENALKTFYGEKMYQRCYWWKTNPDPISVQEANKKGSKKGPALVNDVAPGFLAFRAADGATANFHDFKRRSEGCEYRGQVYQVPKKKKSNVGVDGSKQADELNPLLPAMFWYGNYARHVIFFVEFLTYDFNFCYMHSCQSFYLENS